MASRANKKKTILQQENNKKVGTKTNCIDDAKANTVTTTDNKISTPNSNIISSEKTTNITNGVSSTTAPQKAKKTIDIFRQKNIIAMSLILLIAFIFLCLPFSGLSVTLDLGDIGATTGQKDTTTDDGTSGDTTQSYHVNLSGLMILLTPLQGYDNAIEVIARNVKELDGNKDATYQFIVSAITSLYDEADIAELSQAFWIVYAFDLILLLSFISIIVLLVVIKNNKKLSISMLIANCVHALLAFVLMLTTIIISVVSGSLIVANYGLYLYFVVALGGAILAMLLKRSLKTTKGSV